ncbi:MAG: DUF4393 domain-containing protein [Lactobacillus sp.]|nr:DUF4393 domain-containing protein [Lactobacillus sp.]
MNWLTDLPQEPINKLLNPIGDVLGQGISGILLWVFQEPIKFKIIKENEFQALANELAQKLQSIPTENRDTSKRGLLIKAIKESQYSISESDLRTMFASIVASIADDRKNYALSPRYITVLSQLGAEDAKLLILLNEQKSHQLPIACLRISENKTGAFQDVSEYYYYTDKKKIDILSSTTVNILVSLGIIDFSSEKYLADSSYQVAYTTLNTYLNWYKSTHERPSEVDNSYVSNKGKIELTSFGEQLFEYIF